MDESAYGVELLPFAGLANSCFNYLFKPEDLARWEESSAASQRLKMVCGWGRGRGGKHTAELSMYHLSSGLTLLSYRASEAVSLDGSNWLLRGYGRSITGV